MSRDVEPLPKPPPREPKPRRPLKRGAGLKRGKRLAPVSAKRKAERPAREQMRAEVLARDRTCVARDLVPEVKCGSPFADRPPLEVDEVVGRGQWRAGYLVPENGQALCQLHHDWKHAHPAEARRRGLTASRREG